MSISFSSSFVLFCSTFSRQNAASWLTSWLVPSSIAANCANTLSASLVKASGFSTGRFAANCANATSMSLIQQGLARSAIDRASATSGHSMVGLFANGGGGSFWTATALASRHTSGGAIFSTSESIGEELCCRFCLKWEMCSPFTG